MNITESSNECMAGTPQQYKPITVGPGNSGVTTFLTTCPQGKLVAIRQWSLGN